MDRVLIKGKQHNHPVWLWWRIIFTGLSLFALAMSALLSWHFITGENMTGCGGGSPCESVLSSKWSVIAGILPVSGLAMGLYLAMFFSGFFMGSDTEKTIRDLAWKVILVLAGSVAGGAIWFIVLQKWFIGEFCFYCMTTHMTGLAITVLVCWRTLKKDELNPTDKPGKTEKNTDVPEQLNRTEIPPLHAAGFLLAGLLLAAVMAVVQVGLMPKTLAYKGESQQKITAIDYSNVPIIGSADAPIIVNLLFDYQCTHCQKIHFMLGEAVNRYHGKLAFALCPTPLSTECNKYIPLNVEAFKNSCDLAKTGLAVWKANRDAFLTFDNWMFTYESGDRWHPRKLEIARAKAIELVGQAEFEKAMSEPWINSCLQRSVEIFGQTLKNGKGGIPKLIYGSRWLIPEPENTDDLIRILQQSLGLPDP
ncbi:MAG: vitamin K epoxide reductase family protein [Bacteroidales bacterium]